MPPRKLEINDTYGQQRKSTRVFPFEARNAKNQKVKDKRSINKLIIFFYF